MIKISIIMAVYNGEKDVEGCLDSLVNQSYKNIEIVCIDDGSTDGTLEILNRHAESDSRIKVYAQGENTKLLMAIKRGIREATGDYLMFIDADDWYELNACELVASTIDTEHPDTVIFGTNLVEPDYEVRSEFTANRKDLLKTYNWKFRGENTLDLDHVQYVYLWNKAVRADICRAAYDAIPDVPMLYHSDMYACQMIHYYARSIVSITDKLINYNYANGLSAQLYMTADQFEFFCKCTRIYEDGVAEFFTEHGAVEELRQFKEGYNDRLMLYICTWRDKVKDEDAAAALDSLLRYYDAGTVVTMMKHNYYEVNVARKKHLKMLQDNYLK